MEARAQLVVCPRCGGQGDAACPVCRGCTCLKEQRGDGLVVAVVRGECRADRHGQMTLRVADRR